MAASCQTRRASLADLQADLSTSFMKQVSFSMKSKQQGFKFFSEVYFHSVSMTYGENDTIVSSAKCYRSMKKNEPPHAVHVDIKPEEISYAYCSCQAGTSGSCSHVIGFIIALQQWQLMGFTEVPSKLSSTSLPEQWSKPRCTKVEAGDVPHLVFVNPKPDRKKKPVTNTLTECRNVRVEEADVEHLQGLKHLPIGYLVCNPSKTVHTHVGPVPVGSGLSTHAKFFETEPIKSVGTRCGNLAFPQDATVTLGAEYHIEDMTQEQCEQLEQLTRDQTNSQMWFQARKHRLTASTFGIILKRKTITEKFINNIINEKAFTSAATSYGKSNERQAIEKYIKQSGNHVHDCGLVVNRKFPFLGATPDGKVCEDGITGIIEVKCPYSARDMSISDACCLLPKFCLQNTDGIISIKKAPHNHEYFYQVQGQLMISGAAFCDFVVFTKKDLFIQRIFPLPVFMQQMLDELSAFYFQHVKPVLCLPSSQNVCTLTA
ncbi:uncharacterized protein [Haliotis cracherodii]|uniref:uncharacterized protein n=1 Tax=Haliotis cracherodii TaxID=6455 RepID=UPI0039EBDF29